MFHADSCSPAGHRPHGGTGGGAGQTAGDASQFSRQLLELLTRRSSERATRVCAERAEAEGHNVRRIVSTSPTDDGFLVILRVRKDGDGANLNCRYELASDSASLPGEKVAEEDKWENELDGQNDYLQLPIVRGIAACVDAAAEEGIAHEGVEAAEHDGRRTSVILTEENGGRTPSLCL
ncbi:MAG: hypothetical protein R3C97_15950 [Geminicoccaceae bacterium]